MKTQTVVQPDTWFSIPSEHRTKIRAWLRENELEANDILISEPVTVQGDKIHYTAMLRDENGKIRTAPGTFATDKLVVSADKIQIMVEKRTAPMRSYPPVFAGE